jgi:hypothetical protein
MTRRRMLTLVVALALIAVTVVPLSAQLFGGIVYDPTNYSNAVLRYEQLQQQLAQLITTYQQIRTQYLLLKKQAEKLPFSLESRYRSLHTPWRPLVATSVYGKTTNWIDAANTGHDVLTAFTAATQMLGTYGGTLTRLSTDETARVQASYDRTQLTDGAITNSLEAIGRLRLHEGSVESIIRNLEDDTYSDDLNLHTQIAVLNKINATGVTAARMAKDTNYLLVAILEGQLLEATARREAAVEGINSHIAFLTQAPDLLAQSTAQTTAALTSFRIP